MTDPRHNPTDRTNRPGATGRRGMVSFATLIAVLFLMAFAGLVFNAGQVVTRKIEAQNAADAVAYSSSVWVARGMNAVTAANHMIGELQALYVLHHALGGRFLDESDSATDENGDGLKATNTALDVAYKLPNVGRIQKADKPYDEVSKDPNASKESTIYKAKKRLKQILAAAYGTHVAGGVLEIAFPPYTTAPGIAVQAAALVVEWKVYQEYLVLTAVEKIAYGTKGFAHQIAGVDKDGGERAGGIIEALHDYTFLVQTGCPIQVQRCATDIAKKHGADGMVRGDVPTGVSLADLLKVIPTLPVEPHTHKGEDRAQLMRATYPWVARWRKPTREFFKWTCTMSGASGFYLDYTNEYSGRSVYWMRYPKDKQYSSSLYNKWGMGKKGKDVHLLVVKGLNDTAAGDNGFQKSQEEWNKPDSSLASDRLFGHMGFSHVEPPRVAAASVYRQENPDGLVCFSQSMIYNANPQQEPKANGGGGSPQPAVGWDTLNWTANAPEFPKDSDLGSSPEITLNWQAKLTPVTTTKLVGAAATTLTNQKVFKPLSRCVELVYLNNH